ncbi:MAG TPA: peptidoglycan-binding protein [Mycobacteriales bacterium]|jgi:peptidoglycan hydrolase-like protein with peptidoglycan-binding domain|nr:peptidoglycan-binding protein [Mycobacteriales bacterium]
MRRRTLAFLLIGAVLVSALVTWIASARIRSPAEAAARTAPPAASPILVRVDKRVLATTLVSRGTGHYGSPRDLVVVESALKDGARVVTSRPRVGAALAEGDVLLTISGRPTFLLEGAQPSYRDLGPGMSGRDVRQLETALARARYRPGRVDGRYDGATEAAVRRLYRSHGFDPVVAYGAQLAQPREAELIRGAGAQGGVQVPSDEVVFVADMPLRVTKVPARLGSAPDGALATVTNSVVSVDGALPLDEAGLVKAGQQVVIDEPALGIKARGRVSRVAERPGTEGADGSHRAFHVLVDRAPPAVVGSSVRLTVIVESTREAQLTVPVSAVSLGPDGASRVQRSAGGTLTFVPVEPGLSADGYVVIRPRGALAAGDSVVIGFKRGG